MNFWLCCLKVYEKVEFERLRIDGLNINRHDQITPGLLDKKLVEGYKLLTWH